MAQCYAILILASVAALAGCLQLRPDCSQLDPYALQDGERMELFSKVQAYAPKKNVGLSLVYECALEGMAGLILENSRRPMSCPRSLGYYPLMFQLYVEAEGEADLSSVADFTWEQIRSLAKYSSFGCNHRKDGERHIYLCLFK
ncbi:hypothetical protein ANCCAN_04218 [Ancylostoma caninum]|uniref:SCP domain-containing protein n=1 Tax=Ancylostoma caninum TaxID=29170 RepID=A0A368GZF8_ANCCA|nr:hypothetical protein ANCCAN_04218 [Ancylostoma caninum]